jgi:hypothetical protein
MCATLHVITVLFTVAILMQLIAESLILPGNYAQ